MTKILLATSLVMSLAACAGDPQAPPVSQWSLGDLGQGPLHATGVSTNLATGHLWMLVPGVGLIETTADGHYVSKIQSGAGGYSDYGFTDVTVLEDGSFALPADGEGYKFDAVHGTQPFFCLLPGDNFNILENSAITLDPSSGTMYVAPAYRDQSNHVTSANIAAYASSDGHFISSMDVMSTGVIAQGLAVDAQLGRIWAVEHGTISRFTMTGTLDGQAGLTGVTDAQGVTLVGDQLYVLDGADDEIRVFDRATLNGLM